MRLIDASHENAKAVLEGVPYYPDEIWKFAAMAKRFPTIDPASLRPKGEWGKRENGKPKCSVCGEYHLYAWPDYKNCNFCPNCGADMRGAAHDS